MRAQPIFLKIQKPPAGLAGTLFGNIQRSDDFLIQCVHKNHETAVLVKVSAIIDNMLKIRIVEGNDGVLFEPVIFDTFKLGFAVS